jgi:hypothetical protein
MISYGNVFYGDMPKTASSYIMDFLKDNLRDPKGENSKRHGKTDEPLTSDQFCFVSVREPTAQYVSLYRYGCDGKGGLHDKLRAAGVAERFYRGDVASFEAWAAFVLDPANAKALDGRYAAMSPALYGFMTFRYLILAMPAPIKLLKDIHDKETVRVTLAEHSFVGSHVKTESLKDDMVTLCDGGLKPYLKNRPAALEWLHRDRMKNKSKTPAFSLKDVGTGTLHRIREREWLLYEALGY